MSYATSNNVCAVSRLLAAGDSGGCLPARGCGARRRPRHHGHPCQQHSWSVQPECRPDRQQPTGRGADLFLGLRLQHGQLRHLFAGGICHARVLSLGAAAGSHADRQGRIHLHGDADEQFAEARGQYVDFVSGVDGDHELRRGHARRSCRSPDVRGGSRRDRDVHRDGRPRHRGDACLLQRYSTGLADRDGSVRRSDRHARDHSEQLHGDGAGSG